MFHSWVYVHFDDGGEEDSAAASFFVESTTGERRALGDERYAALNCLWNQVRMAGFLKLTLISQLFGFHFALHH